MLNPSGPPQSTKLRSSSFLGEGDELQIDRWVDAGADSTVDHGAPNLTDMAGWAMHFLMRNPQRPLDCTCRFSISPLAFPPAPGDDELDAIMTGDTELRMELEFIYMREMSGSTDGADVETAIRNRLLSYIREDGLCWCDPRCLAEFHDRRPTAMPGTTAGLLRSTAERYLRDSDKSHLDVCHQLVAGLKSLAKSEGSIKWYDGGPPMAARYITRDSNPYRLPSMEFQALIHEPDAFRKYLEWPL